MPGLAHPDMTGTVLGAVKTGIPIGGVIVPLLITTLTGATSFAAALWVLPVALFVGLFLLSLPVVSAAIAAQPATH